MNKQLMLSTPTVELGQAATYKKDFLQQVDHIIPWCEWKEIIKPHYYHGERCNKPFDPERMLRTRTLQRLYNLSDMATMMEIIDSRAFSDFNGVDSSNQIPDGDTTGRFRGVLVKNRLQQKLFAQVVGLLSVQGLILKKSTNVGSTLIAIPSSTMNREKKRGPNAHQMKNGNAWYFGYKAHNCVGRETALVHHVRITGANVQDVKRLERKR